MCELWDGVQKGDHERALELHSQLLAFWNACDLENLPACVKYAQTLQGRQTFPRRPMPEARPEARVRIQGASECWSSELIGHSHSDSGIAWIVKRFQ